MNNTKIECENDRRAFREKMEKMIRFADGYYYIGGCQPATSTGRYATREAAIRYQMDCFARELTPPFAA